MTAPLDYQRFVAEFITPVKEALSPNKGKYDVISQLNKQIQVAGDLNFIQLKNALVGFKEECDELYRRPIIKNNDRSTLIQKLDDLAKLTFPSVDAVQKKAAAETQGVFPEEIMNIILAYSLGELRKDPLIIDSIKGLLKQFCRSPTEELRVAKVFAEQIGIGEGLIKTARDSDQVIAFVENFVKLRDQYKLSDVEAIFGTVTADKKAAIDNLPLNEQGKAWLAIVVEKENELDKKTILDLANKSLSGLPGLVYFENLKFLSAANNRMTTLPDDITKLKELQVLDISKNAIPKLPEGMRSMSNLRGLVIAGNPISNFDQLIDCLPLTLKTLTISEDDQWYRDNEDAFRKALKEKRPGVELWERGVDKKGNTEDNPVR